MPGRLLFLVTQLSLFILFLSLFVCLFVCRSFFDGFGFHFNFGGGEGGSREVPRGGTITMEMEVSLENLYNGNFIEVRRRERGRGGGEGRMEGRGGKKGKGGRGGDGRE